VATVSSSPGRSPEPASWWPTLRWFASELGLRRWTIVGDDYIWPRASARLGPTATWLSCGGVVCDEMYVPLGTEDFEAVLDRVVASRCDGVLMLLIGQSTRWPSTARSAVPGWIGTTSRFSSFADRGERACSRRGAENNQGTDDLGRLLRRPADRFRCSNFASDLLRLLRSGWRRCSTAGRVLLRGRSGAAIELLHRPARWTWPRIQAMAEGLEYESPRGTCPVRDRHLMQARLPRRRGRLHGTCSSKLLAAGGARLS